MSEFTNHKQKRVNQLVDFAWQMMVTTDKAKLVKANEQLISQVIPSEVIALFDVMVKEFHDLDFSELKPATNKMLHLFHLPLKSYPGIKPEKDSFLDLLIHNNAEMEKLLKSMKIDIKTLNENSGDKAAKTNLLQKLTRFLKYEKHYQIKENVLFPALEKHWDDFRCVQLMWSYHDDIRQQLKGVIQALSTNSLDLSTFNRLTGDLFFNVFAIRFREEYILFPHILETIPQQAIQQMLVDSHEIGFPYVSPAKVETTESVIFCDGTTVNLGTGNGTPEQLLLIFNHLPVDITFVDEQDTVRYFSTPKKRIFPRTKAIIGRKIHNCHPPESVHVVEEIVSAFRNDEKDQASFWIDFKGEKILIQYFALRDENGIYKGVIEVTQEIGDIQKLEGEKRLLDWKK
ncbi:MAG TPA: PAS domain-containing protein [Sunxiuqinia sp.]|nr:PAS domain-containing protein [Sunxiuqinia sp.]